MSKIGIHFSAAPRHDRFGDYLAQAAQAGSPFAAVMALDQNIMPDILRVSPQTIGVFRHQIKNARGEGQDDAVLGVGDGRLRGRQWIMACEPVFAQNPDFPLYSATNELNAKNPDHHRWAAAYYLGQMERADENNIKLVWGNFSTGEPDYPDWLLYYADCVSHAARFGHVLGLHEYGLDLGAMRHAEPDRTLRYRKVYQAIVGAGLSCPQLLISECAPGSNVDSDLASLKADLEWYDAALMSDAAAGIPVLGACLYQWGSDEAALFAKAMPVITQHVKTHPSPPQTPDDVHFSGTIAGRYWADLAAWVSTRDGVVARA